MIISLAAEGENCKDAERFQHRDHVSGAEEAREEEGCGDNVLSSASMIHRDHTERISRAQATLDVRLITRFSY
jgi:hypothetical protein